MRPKLYQENKIWICTDKKIKATGSSAVEAFLNFVLAKASSHLRPEETDL